MAQLPELPEPKVCYLHTPAHECDPMKMPEPKYAFTAEQMQAYARQALSMAGSKRAKNGED